MFCLAGYWFRQILQEPTHYIVLVAVHSVQQFATKHLQSMFMLTQDITWCHDTQKYFILLSGWHLYIDTMTRVMLEPALATKSVNTRWVGYFGTLADKQISNIFNISPFYCQSKKLLLLKPLNDSWKSQWTKIMWYKFTTNTCFGGLDLNVVDQIPIEYKGLV